MVRRPFNFGIVGAALTLMCILALVFGMGAIALRGRTASANLLKVPAEYPSIQAAVDASEDGDVIQIAPGVYNGTIRLNKPVTLVAENYDQINPVNNTAILDGVGGVASIVIPPNMTQMPTIRGFVIRNSGTAIQAQSPFILEFSYLNSATYLVNYMIGSGGINRGNVYFGSRDDAIHVENTSRPLVIENNRVMYAGDDGIEISLQSNPALPTITEIDVWNNMIIGSAEDGIQFIDFPANPADTNRRFVIVGNLIADNKRAGLGLMPNSTGGEDYSGADVSEAIRAYNDTFYGNEVGISGGDNLVAFNNIIVNSTRSGVSKVQGPAGANSVVAYTLFFHNGMDSDQSMTGAGILSGRDPLFAAPPNPGPDGIWNTVDDDFSGLLLSADSPAIDQGVTQYSTANGELVPPSPIMGFTGTAPDLGWREFGSPIFMTPTPTLRPTMTLLPTNTSFVLTPIITATQIQPTLTPPAATLTPASSLTPGPSQTPAASPSPTAAAQSPTPTSVAPTASGPTVTPTPQLTIQSIDPVSAPAGTTVDITLTGNGFANESVVTFEGGQGTAPEVIDVQLLNPQTLVIRVRLTDNAIVGGGPWDIRITNPDQTTFVLQDAFTVTAKA